MKDNMQEIKKEFETILKLFKVCLKWIVIAVVIGTVVGIVSALFHIGIKEATDLRVNNDYIILFLPLAGVIIVMLYKALGMDDDKGTNRVILAVRSNEKLTFKTTFLIFVASILTHLCGGSSGREGAALQIGGSMGSRIGQLLKLDENDLTIITMCGMSAGFGALFGTPVAAAIFAMEIISIGIMHYSAIISCVISAVTGTLVSEIFGIMPTAFTIKSFPEIGLKSVGEVILLATLCALLSMIFCILMRIMGKFYKEKMPNQYIRIAVGGAIVVALSFIIGTRDYNGAGITVINNAFTGTSRPEAFALKIIFTVLTLSVGFKGGEIVPIFFIGATFGNVFASLFGMEPSFGAGIGMVAMFCGATNCPLASILLSVELFGGKGIIYYAIAAAVSYILSGYEGLYSEQKILYSKLKPVYIDKIIGHR